MDILAHVRRGGRVLGLCGGYQMLGREIRDPLGIEGPPGAVAGLGLLDVVTTLGPEKATVLARGVERLTGCPVEGYEIHVGRTDGPDARSPMLDLAGRPDGAVTADGRVMGCYLHGLFESDALRAAFLGRLRDRAPTGTARAARIEGALDALAEHLERCLDLDRLLAIAREVSTSPMPPPR